jgi:hypothetical protein
MAEAGEQATALMGAALARLLGTAGMKAMTGLRLPVAGEEAPPTQVKNLALAAAVVSALRFLDSVNNGISLTV